MTTTRRAAVARVAIPALGVVILVCAITIVVAGRRVRSDPAAPIDEVTNMIHLPAASTTGELSVQEALANRRSHRDFAPTSLTLAQLGQLLWAAQGCTNDRCHRTAPSAGATFPLELFAVTGTGSVEGLDAGVWWYRPPEHALEPVVPSDLRAQLSAASLGQKFIQSAPVTIVFAADPGRTAKLYGQRATRYVFMEVGHAGQNVYLQAEALGLETVAVGAFEDARVAEHLSVPDGLDVLYLMPVGHAAR